MRNVLGLTTWCLSCPLSKCTVRIITYQITQGWRVFTLSPIYNLFRVLHSCIPIWKKLHITSKDPFTYSYPPRKRSKDLRSQNINFISSCKERSYVPGILVGPIPLYKHQVSSSPRYRQFLSSYTFELSEILLLLTKLSKGLWSASHRCSL